MFRERTPARTDAARQGAQKTDQAVDQALAELLQSRSLRAHPLSRNCEIGPFVVDYVFSEASLIVELQACPHRPDRHGRARTAFLGDMGYRIVRVPRQEVLSHPQRALARIQAALAPQPGPGS